jgi:4-carboxymuconolactone decarboxylase
MEIAQQEVFGPVLSVCPSATTTEAIEIANGTDYGLVAGVFTRDLDRATRAARRCAPGRSSSTNGMPAASKRPSAAMENPAMAGKRGARRSGTTCRPRTSRSGWVYDHDRISFDEDLFLKGLERRKATLGAEYVEKNLAAADDFTRPFQEAMTAWCWGFGWGDDVIDAKTRSMMNLAMIGALGKMTEWEIHCRGAIRNGVTKEEIRAIIHVVGIYCGVPQALECFRVRTVASDSKARQILQVLRICPLRSAVTGACHGHFSRIPTKKAAAQPRSQSCSRSARHDTESVKDMNFLVRKAKINDLNQLIEFTLSEAREAEGLVLEFNRIHDGVKAALIDSKIANYWVIVDQSDNLVGSVSVIKEWSDWNAGYYWWIQGMYLLPAYRGKGLMKSMIDEVESEMNKSGGLELRLYVHTENHAAIRAYEKAKFTDSKYRIMVLNKKD